MQIIKNIHTAILTALCLVFILSLVLNINVYPFLAATSPIIFIRIFKHSPFKWLFIFYLLILILISYTLYYDYLQNPWFEIETNQCDGPCFGWYGFERDILLEQTKHITLYLSSISGYYIFSYIYKKIRKNKK